MRLPSGFELNVTAIKVEDIPTEDRIIQAGYELMQASQSWEHTNDYCSGVVHGYKPSPQEKDDGMPWFARVSLHSPDEVSFNEFWFGLGCKKPVHESKYIHNIDQTVLLKRLSEHAEIWCYHYRFSGIISNRTFTILQVAHLNSSGQKTGLIVSLPIDVSSDAHLAEAELPGERGRYVAVERIRELDDGKIEWRMATSSTPGGMLPKLLVNAISPGQIANDVPLFLEWLRSDREYFKKGIAGCL